MRFCLDDRTKPSSALPVRPPGFIALLCLAFATNACTLDRNLNAENGLIRILPESGASAVNLVGEWELYRNRLYTARDFADRALAAQIATERRVYRIPGAWSRDANADPPAFGFATLRLRWTGDLPPDAVFYLRWAGSAYRLLCGADVDERGGEVGESAANSRPSFRPLLARATPDCLARREIILQISNFHYTFGGPVYPVQAGPLAAILRARLAASFGDLALLGLASGVGLYHLVIWLVRRREGASLFFALVCLAFLTRVNATSALLPQFWPDLDLFAVHIKLSFVGVYLLVAFFAEFLRRLFPDEFDGRLVAAIAGASAVFSVHCLVSEPLAASEALNVYVYFMIGALIYNVYGTALAVWREREGAALMALGIFTLCSAAIHDVLVQQQALRHPYVANAGFCLFLLAQSAILARGYSRAFTTAEHLTQHLEREVAEHTAALTKANEKLRRADADKTAFFQNISHELRTSLTLINGPLESAVRRNESLDPDAQQGALISSRRLLRIVNRLLDLQKIQAGRLRLDQRPLQIQSFFSVSLSAFGPYATTRNVALHVDIAPDLPVVFADPDKLDKCVYNYLSNALKFTPAGGRVDVRATQDRGGVRFEVSDTGVGIEEALRGGLFERFGVSQAALSGQEGSGLGLAIVRELIELHGGEVGFESSAGRGSRFWFWLPPAGGGVAALPQEFAEGRRRALVELSDVELAPTPLTLDPKPGDLRRMLSGRVLVVEDNPDLLRYAANILQREGYNVLPAENAGVALELIQLEQPDLIVTDYNLNGASGMDLVRAVRGSFRHNTTPIILLTAWGEEELRRRAYREGVDAFLSKPFQDLELLSLVRNLFALKSRERLFRRESEHARRIQNNLLPAGPPRAPGLAIAACYAPAEEIGGDLYDLIEQPDKSLVVFVADVSGHGVPAALIAAISKLSVQPLVRAQSSPGAALEILNNQLAERTAGHFVTCSLARFSPDRRSLLYASAGHPPPVLLRSGNASLLPCRGKAIGISRAARYEDYTLALQAGDRIVFYTDGVLETRDPENSLYGEERLLNFTERCADLRPEQFVEALLAEMRAFRRQSAFEDDVTIVTIDATAA